MLNEALIKEFGLRIRQLRSIKNISQEKLSFLTGFHRTYIGKKYFTYKYGSICKDI